MYSISFCYIITKTLYISVNTCQHMSTHCHSTGLQQGLRLTPAFNTDGEILSQRSGATVLDRSLPSSISC